MAPSPITSWQIDGETMETVTDFIFLGSEITADSDCSHEIKTLAPWKKSYDKPRQHIKKQRHHFADKSLYSQNYDFSSCCHCSVAQSCLTLCEPMDCSMPGVLHCLSLSDFTQTHVHWVDNSIKPSHPLSPTSPFALNLLQHQGLFQWVSRLFVSGGQSTEASVSASLLPINI